LPARAVSIKIGVYVVPRAYAAADLEPIESRKTKIQIRRLHAVPSRARARPLRPS
jgi:hypothetical protein